MEQINFNKQEIESIFEKAEKVLLDKKNITNILYSNNSTDSFDNNNQDLLNTLKKCSIVYCLWVGKSKNKLKPIYVGHASQKIARQRIRNHLGKKNIKTGAKLDNVKLELEKENYIGISMLKIHPDYMRKSLEEWIIDKHSGILEWNQVGKRKS